MKCFPELTYSIYADGELPAEEVRQVEAHLAVCPRCRALADAWRMESRLLAKVLQEVPNVVSGRSKVGLSILWTAASALVAALGLDQAVTGIERMIPSSAGWLNQFSRAWIENLLFNAGLNLVREGPALLNGLMTAVGFGILLALIVTSVRFFAKHHPMSLAVLAGLGLVVLMAQPASAIERRKGNVVSVAAGETVQDSLLATGDTVDIVGNVNGNLFAACQRMTVRGDVKGDVVSFGQIVQIEGTVEGNVYAWAETVTISGHVTGSVFGWTQTVTVESGGRVDMDVTSGGEDLRVDGNVGRNVSFLGASTELKGAVGGNFQAYAGQVAVLSSSRIGGSLEAHVDKKEQVDIEPGATIAGKTDIRLKEKPRSKYTERSFYFWQAIELVAALILGLLVFWLFPTLFGARIATAGALLRELGIGFLILIATPIAAIIAGITLVGLPVAILSLMAWIAGCYLAKVFVAAWIGRTIVPSRPAVGSSALGLLLGLAIIFVAVNLPYVGGWLWLLVLLVGLGMAFSQWHRSRRAIAP
ncbi:MAG TPA: zf-HC2 domain-containing protein [Terriglobia bacterium]|nr:zf-HC2 domain-containing protein [Terriglobia bacterium]